MTGDDTTTFDQELLNDGLWLSLIGMGVVFAVLSLMAISIKVFERVDSRLSASTPATTATVSAPSSPGPAPQPAEEPVASAEAGDAEIAAAIAVSLALAEREDRGTAPPSAGQAPRHATNAWLSSGRSREMTQRTQGYGSRARGSR